MPTESQFVFYCRPKFLLFSGSDTEPIEEGDVMSCQECGGEHQAEEQRGWMEGLVKAHEKGLSDDSRRRIGEASRHRDHTGPNTEQGKRRSSINALKHGGNAHVHRLPPARPGELHECLTCPYAPATVSLPQQFRLSSVVQGETVRPEVNTGGDDSCKQEKWLYCVRQSEVLVQLANADGPEAIRSLLRNSQGLAIVNLDAALRQVAADGPTVESAIIKLDKDGNPLTLGTELRPHPALKTIEVHSNLLGGLNLADSHLTPKSAKQSDDRESLADALNELLLGHRSSAPKELPAPNDESSDAR
jgi:hypothetical protein